MGWEMWLQAGAGNGGKCSTRGAWKAARVSKKEEREEGFVQLVDTGAY